MSCAVRRSQHWRTNPPLRHRHALLAGKGGPACAARWHRGQHRFGAAALGGHSIQTAASSTCDCRFAAVQALLCGGPRVLGWAPRPLPHTHWQSRAYRRPPAVVLQPFAGSGAAALCAASFIACGGRQVLCGSAAVCAALAASGAGDAAQHSTAQHSTAQHSTAQHSTAATPAPSPPPPGVDGADGMPLAAPRRLGASCAASSRPWSTTLLRPTSTTGTILTR